MSEKHEPGMAYSMPKLNKIMAILSFILLVSTLWVFLDDYIRPWKAIQVEAIKIKRRHIQLELDAAQKEIDEAKLSGLQTTFSKGQEVIATRKTEIEKAEKELLKVRALITAQTIKNGFYNADSTALNYQYEDAARNNREKEAAKKSGFGASKHVFPQKESKTGNCFG